MKKLLLFILGFGKLCNAQDIYFLNPFITANYLNPSLAGHQNVNKLSAAYLNMYPNLSGTTVTYFLNVETKLYNKLGIAANLISDDMARGTMQANQYILMLNYNFKLNNSFTLTPGFKFSQLENKIDLTKLNFGDAINMRNAEVWSQPQPLTFATRLYNYSFTGSLLFGHKAFNFGAILNQFNEPEIGMINFDLKQQRRLTLHSMVKLPIEKQTLNLFFRYDRQGNFNKTQLAAYMRLFEHYQIGLGFNSFDNYTLHTGYGNKYFRINYNYNLSFSKLSGNTAGSHELGTAFYFLSKNKRNSFDKYLE